MTSRHKSCSLIGFFALLALPVFAARPASADDAPNPLVRIELTRPSVTRTALVSCDRPFLIENERGDTIVRASADAVYSLALTAPTTMTITDGVASTDPEASESGAQAPAFSATASQIVIYGSGGIVRIAGNPIAPIWHGYHGNLRVAPQGSQLMLCNLLPLETYLLGVLGPEIGGDAPIEAMKAQAIATRTYTIRNLGKLAAVGADLDDTTRFQSYTGTDSETASVREAVMQTQGRVLTYDGQLIDAVYATDCGGRTAQGPPSEPYLQPVDDPDCAAKASWTYSLPLTQLTQLVISRLHCVLGRVASLEAGQADASGRIGQVTLNGSDGGSVSLTAAQIRQAIGYDLLRSTWFTVSLTPDQQCLFAGRGWGHGLGMCQRGAIAMASGAKPASYWAILTHYYTGVQIVPLTPDLLRQDPSRTRSPSSNTGGGGFLPLADGGG